MMPSQKPAHNLVHVRLPVDLIEKLDRFRHATAWSTRNAAVRWLIEAGLNSKGAAALKAMKGEQK